MSRCRDWLGVVVVAVDVDGGVGEAGVSGSRVQRSRGCSRSRPER